MMLTHNWMEPQKPRRVVVLGSRGFVGAALVARLEAAGWVVCPIPSVEIDLTAPEAAEALVARLNSDDALVMLSALTPDRGRDIDAMMRNLEMGRSVCRALAERPVAHVVYVSSDAVYPFDAALVSERTLPAPADLYGCMHHTREIMFRTTVKGPLTILRPTLIYGATDTHNSYGPNRFRRQAVADGCVVLGGQGEETRDHIHIDDAVELIGRVLAHRSVGVLNLATGRSVAFADLAKLVTAQFDRSIEIRFTPRTTAVTHRSFDVTACLHAFPDFAFAPLEDGLAATHRAAGLAIRPEE